MTPEQRREEIIDISADIWIRHCSEQLEKKGQIKNIDKGWW